jgi:nucleotide-binding universal stress UspA family protein
MVFKRIILPINKSNEYLKVTKKAIQLAKKLNINVTAIYVLNTKIFAEMMPTNQMYAYKYYKNIKHRHKENAHKFLNKIEKIAHEKDIDVQTILIEGNPEKKILKEADENDLIVMSSKNISTLNRVFLSSLSEKILHSSSSTFMIMR